jgi:hypothetical protein
LLHEGKSPEARNAVVFTVCQSDLYKALLSADVRFAAFLPCRIAALSYGEEVLLEAVSPAEFCRLLNRDDLDRLTLPLETALREIMEEAAAPALSRAATAQSGRGNPWGATEDQVNMRMTLAPRIDCHGTKIEDLAGTGKPETLGG